MKCSSSCRRRRASAKPSSGASISTRRACAASSKRCSLCPPHPTASPPPRWRLGCAHSASKAHHSTVPATLCCTDQQPGAVSPPQRHLREANVLRPAKLEHAVQRGDSNGHLGHLPPFGP